MNRFFGNGQKVLFMGDSITDWGRDHEDSGSLGTGYPSKIAGIHALMFPDIAVEFINIGISGARISDLITMSAQTMIDIKPDFISIFVGINDVWRRYDSGEPRTADVFKTLYEELLKMIKSHLPETKILLIEPFVLNSLPDRASWREDLDPKILAVREVAASFADYYLPLDGIMASKCTGGHTATELSEDGVHPTDTGHAVITEAWLRTLGIL